MLVNLLNTENITICYPEKSFCGQLTTYLFKHYNSEAEVTLFPIDFTTTINDYGNNMHTKDVLFLDIIPSKTIEFLEDSNIYVIAYEKSLSNEELRTQDMYNYLITNNPICEFMANHCINLHDSLWKLAHLVSDYESAKYTHFNKSEVNNIMAATFTRLDNFDSLHKFALFEELKENILTIDTLFEEGKLINFQCSSLLQCITEKVYISTKGYNVKELNIIDTINYSDKIVNSDTMESIHNKKQIIPDIVLIDHYMSKHKQDNTIWIFCCAHLYKSHVNLHFRTNSPDINFKDMDTFASPHKALYTIEDEIVKDWVNKYF